VLSLVIAVGAVALAASDRATALQEGIHRSDRLALARSLSTLADGYFLELDLDQAAKAAALAPALGSPSTAAPALAASLVGLAGGPQAVVEDPAGLALAATSGAGPLTAALAAPGGPGAGLRTQLAGGQPAVSQIVDLAGRPSVIVATGCGSTGDVLIVSYQLAGLPVAAYVQKLQIGPGAVSYVVDANGRLVTSPDPTRIGHRAPPAVLAGLARATGSTVVQTPGPSPDVVAVDPVGIAGWRLAIVQPAPAFYGSLWHGNSTVRWALLALLVVAAAALLAFHSRRQAALQAVADMAVRDALTGLPNRLAFTRVVEQAVSRHRRGESDVALLFCDLDGFKTVNDQLGHAAGDALLVAAADRLRASVQSCAEARPELARLGGDEFTVLLQGRWAHTAAGQLATALTDAFAEPFVLGPSEVNVGVSVGVAFAHPDRDLLRDADVAMYRAKAVRKAARAAGHPDWLAGGAVAGMGVGAGEG
jgi:diguanylate cyclase (GGDEF)-like protein